MVVVEGWVACYCKWLQLRGIAKLIDTVSTVDRASIPTGLVGIGKAECDGPLLGSGCPTALVLPLGCGCLSVLGFGSLGKGAPLVAKGMR